MKKKQYMKPEQRVVLLHHRTMLLSGSPVRSVSTNMTDEDDDFLWGGGGTQDAR